MLHTIALTAAIAAAVKSERLDDGCTPSQTRSAIAGADAQRLGNLNGNDIVLVSLRASCMCGNVNCPYLVVRAGGNPGVLFATYAFAVDVLPSSDALPRLREHAHDSALVTDETLDAFRAPRYVAIDSARVRGDTNQRKPNALPVRFTAGASSARLAGSVAIGWYDDYSFAAARGQLLSIEGVRSSAKLALTLFGPADAKPVDLRAGKPVALDRSGTYTLHVENDREDEAPYAFTLAIR